MQQLISPPEDQQLISGRVCQPQLGFPLWLFPGTWRGLSRRRPGLPARPSEAHSGNQCGPAVPTPPPGPSPCLLGFNSAPVSPLGSQADRPPFTLHLFPHLPSPGLYLACSWPRGHLAAPQGPPASRVTPSSPHPSQSYPGERGSWGQRDAVPLLASPLAGV